MARDYPPLNSLLVFLSASRQLSFTTAAEELFVTRSAVSRQIKLLEDYLGHPLFHRNRSGLTLTEAGVEYANQLAPIFTDLRNATEALRGTSHNNKLKLGLSSTFNATWLMSRLADFYTQNPDIEINFHTNNFDSGDESVDFSSGLMDCAIRFGRGMWPNTLATKLFDIYVQPVCSPQLLGNKRTLSVEELSKFNWLGYKHLPNLWPRWLEGSGESYSSYLNKTDIVFDNVAVAVQAAVDGLGIIPMYRPLADPLIKSGKLVVAHKAMRPLDDAYYFVSTAHYERHKPTAIFRKWLLEQSSEFEKQWLQTISENTVTELDLAASALDLRVH